MTELERIVEEMSNVFVRVSDTVLGLPDTGREAKEVLRDGIENFLKLGRKVANGENNLGLPSLGSEDAEADIIDGQGELEDEMLFRDSNIQRHDENDMLCGNQFHEVETTPLFPESQNFLDPSNLPWSSDIIPQAFTFPQSLTAPKVQELPSFTDNSYQHPATQRNVTYVTSSSVLPQNQYRLPSPLPGYSLLHTLPQNSQPGASALPFILAGRDSFSAHLYFTTIVFAFRAIRGEPNFAESANYFFRHKLRYGRRARVITVVGKVVDVMLGGGGRVDTVTSYPNPLLLDDSEHDRADMEDQEIKQLILKDIEREGDREDDYLNTWGVEDYLKRRWRLAIDSSTVRSLPNGVESGVTDPRRFAPTVLIGWDEKGGRREVVRDAREMVEKLMVRAVTIGEGPRWSKRNIDQVVRDFLIKTP